MLRSKELPNHPYSPYSQQIVKANDRLADLNQRYWMNRGKLRAILEATIMKRRGRSLYLALTIVVAAAAWSTDPLHANTIKIGGTGGALGVMSALRDGFRKKQPDVSIVIIPGLGSGGARQALKDGVLDVAVTARPWKKTEAIEGAVTRLYGRTPLILTVPKSISVSDLSVQEILDIYAGKKLTWPNGERLRLILRPLADSDTELLSSIGPDMEQAVKNAHAREGMTVAITDEEAANTIESTKGAIGSTTLSLILSEKRRLTPLTVKSIAPNPKNIASGSYPWFKSFYLSTRVQTSPSARQFVEFVMSAPGQEIVAQLGHWLP